MSELVLKIVLEGVAEPVVYPIPTLDPGGIRRSVAQWMERGIWVQRSDAGYNWYAPREIQRVETPVGNLPRGAFDPFSVQQPPGAPPQVVETPTEAVTCPHCGQQVVPTKVPAGPNARLPKCPNCTRIIREGDKP